MLKTFTANMLALLYVLLFFSHPSVADDDQFDVAIAQLESARTTFDGIDFGDLTQDLDDTLVLAIEPFNTVTNILKAVTDLATAIRDTIKAVTELSNLISDAQKQKLQEERAEINDWFLKVNQTVQDSIGRIMDNTLNIHFQDIVTKLSMLESLSTTYALFPNNNIEDQLKQKCCDSQPLGLFKGLYFLINKWFGDSGVNPDNRNITAIIVEGTIKQFSATYPICDLLIQVIPDEDYNESLQKYTKPLLDLIVNPSNGSADPFPVDPTGNNCCRDSNSCETFLDNIQTNCNKF